MGNSKSSIETCMDPYLLLEVPYTATIEDIKKAYRKMAKKWHPDKNGGSLDAAEMFRNVKAAYSHQARRSGCKAQVSRAG